jgi:DNA-binding Lrp family transcriptional regulator
MKVLFEKESTIKLDAKDWAILNALIDNERQPISKIAKKCLLSRQSVDYRIKQMTENGLITGYRTVVDVKKFGYNSYHVFINVNNKIQEALLKNSAVHSESANAIISYKGKYCYELSIMARNPEEFQKKYSEIIKGISITDDEPLLLVKTVTGKVLPEKFIKKIKKPEQKIPEKKHEEYVADEIDIKLLKLLSNNANINNIALAKKLEISKDTVTYRIRKLVNSGYIINFRPAINYDSIGLSIETVLLKLNTQDGIEELEKYMRGNDNILWAARTFGSYDYIIYILSEDISEFHKTFNLFKDKFGNMIRDYELLFAYSQEKYSFMAECIGKEKV